ncbi:ATP-binding region, ATPase-like [Rhodopseudomonas palustris BisB5]|uniref:histidine kinase n=1 Tax=Rhodopseudomonas palustris (strain BisB5) TaxID=316057 RepID=Q135C6_RHOPS|nr:ATP-binding region, ATPase-like [Rhodopseudomonas palustris BisB5]
MRAAVQAHDWASTPLGPSDHWPAPLRVTVATMLATAVPSFIVWGPEQTLIYNDGYIELLAKRHPAALGRSFRDVWPEIWSDLEPLVRRAYDGEALSQQNLPLLMERRGYVEETWFTYFYTPISLDDGSIGGFLCGCIENTEPMRSGKALEEANAKLQQAITEQRAAHDAVGRSEARYRALFEAIDDGFCIIEFFDGPHGPLSDYVHVEANAGYERQTGIPDIVGRTVRDLVPDEADGWVELYRDVLFTGRAIHFERDFVAVNRIIEVSASRIEPESRRQVSVLFRDITARKQSEAALRASETLARENVQRVKLALAAGAIIGTWLWDLPNDRFTVDEAFARAFGLDPAKGREGLSLAQIVETVHPDDQAGLAAAINEAVKRGGSYAHQYRVRRADGKYYWLEANGRVDHGPDGKPLSFPGVLIDVEDRRALVDERDRAISALRSLNETLEQRIAESRAELLRSEEQLRQSQKMEAVGQLTGGLAHDFNNLLAGISGSLELMTTRISQGRLKDVDKYLVAAQGAVKRAASLTHRLLAFARRQTLTPTAANVNKLVSGMLDLIQRTVGPGIEVQHVGATGLWAVLVDVPQLESALLNLCINARDAMPSGGKITIETGNRWIDRVQSRIYDIPTGQYVSLCVSDTGTGMTRDVIAKAFDPFFTTKPIGQGTGLGLSMIYGFAQQSGGQVRIYSEVGEGAMVCIYLPRHRGNAAEDERSPDSTVIPFAEAGETVLVVDDEPTVRMLVADVLEDLGYTALEAADSVGGLRILQSEARIDLLVTDVGLPGGMNGRQLADAARESRPNLNVLFITGFAENALLNNGQLEPGMAVLTKPFAVDTLAARIRELIAK